MAASKALQLGRGRAKHLPFPGLGGIASISRYAPIDRCLGFHNICPRSLGLAEILDTQAKQVETVRPALQRLGVSGMLPTVTTMPLEYHGSTTSSESPLTPLSGTRNIPTDSHIQQPVSINTNYQIYKQPVITADTICIRFLLAAQDL